MKYCFTLNAVLSVAFFPLQSSIVIRPTFPLILSWCSDNCFIPVLAWKKNCHALINTLRTQTLTVKIGALTKAWHLLWPISPLLPSLNYGALSCTYKAYTTKPKTQLPPTRQTKHIIVQYNTAPPFKKNNNLVYFLTRVFINVLLGKNSNIHLYCIRTAYEEYHMSSTIHLIYKYKSEYWWSIVNRNSAKNSFIRGKYCCVKILWLAGGFSFLAASARSISVPPRLDS